MRNNYLHYRRLRTAVYAVHMGITVPNTPMHVAFRGATLKSNNTGELTAIGEALTWIKSIPYTPGISHEICSDSSYGLDEVDI